MNLQNKFLIPIILLVILLGLYLRLYWAPRLLEFIEEEETATITSHLRSVSHGIVPLLLENQLANVYDNLDSVIESNESWKVILLYDRNNRLLYPLTAPDNLAKERDLITIKQPVKVFDDTLGHLELIVDLSASKYKLEVLQTRLSVVLLIAFVIFIFSIYKLINHILYKPLNSLINAAQRMSAGEFDTELPKQRKDEIGKLINSFSGMRKSIEKYQHELKTEIEQHKSTANELYRQKEHATYQASHDALTGLYNRREFEYRLADTVDEAHIQGNVHALVYMDLDQFKVVNDTCGHTAGDALLKQLTSLLVHRVRESDVLARLGGDEFGLILKDCPIEKAKMIAMEISHQIQDFRFEWHGSVYRVGVSMGLVPITQNSHDLTALLSAADTACYTAKDLGRNKIHVHSDEDLEVTSRLGEMQWVSEISKALEEQRFSLYGQSVTNINDPHNNIEYCELLLRLHGKNDEIILPGAFLPAAERYNQIELIDRYVIGYICSHLSQSKTKKCFGINISGASISNESFLTYVINTFKKNGIDGANIVIEITESVIISDLNKAKTFISTLRGYGCKFALDDFGMGLSSLEYLKHLEVDYLKIDGYFVRDIGTDPIDREMIRAITEICRILDVKSIAEFVESEDIYKELCEIGVDFIQGYWITKPRPLADCV